MSQSAGVQARMVPEVACKMQNISNPLTEATVVKRDDVLAGAEVKKLEENKEGEGQREPGENKTGENDGRSTTTVSEPAAAAASSGGEDSTRQNVPIVALTDATDKLLIRRLVSRPDSSLE